MNLVQARILLVEYINAQDPSSAVEMTEDSFYDDFRSGKSEEELVFVNAAITSMKAAAQAQGE